jgi:hypothetical protein
MQSMEQPKATSNKQVWKWKEMFRNVELPIRVLSKIEVAQCC